jgi:chromosome segregation ATPase
MLATSVELDAFDKVKKAINDMISTLKTQQADEVKKNDWCKESIQENEMTSAKTDDHKQDLEAKKAQLESDIKALDEGIKTAKANIGQTQLDLQRATEDRKTENFDYQKTIGDQAVTIEVLKKALDKLATFYDSEFLQTGVHQGKKQTPPVPQMEYKKSAGATGVMSMIEKLIDEAKQLMADSKKSEQEAQAAYEELIANSNASIAALTEEATTKSKNMAKAKKSLIQTESDIMDTFKELEGLHKENADLHAECDYVLKNFDVRQKARGEEVEALQQAMQILNGASLS